MILQAGGPPDTSLYYHVAYTWVAVVYIGYMVFLWSRTRRAKSRRGALERGGIHERPES